MLMKKFFTKNKYAKYFLAIILVIIVLIAGYFFFFSSQEHNQNTIIVAPADFIQTVTVSGKVVADKNVELGFNRSGRINQVFVNEGQRVEVGQLIAGLDARDAQLSLENARLDLAKMVEDNNVSKISGLAKNYEDSLNNINKTFIDLPNIIDGLEDVIIDYQVSPYKSNLPNDTAIKYFEQASKSFSRGKNIYQTTLTKYQSLQRPLSDETIALMNEETYMMLQSLSQMIKDSSTYINYTYDNFEKNNRSSQLITDRSNIADWLQTINDDLSAIGAGRNTLKNSTLGIETQKIIVDQKANDYANYFLRAPFAGVITRLDAKTGEYVSTGQVGAAMISDSLFQIESYVPEVNIANLKVGNPAKVSLDAYGPDTFFDATVVYIDPAETIKDGVSNYKIKLQFNLNDTRIRSGMTANVVITSENKQNVISLPAGAIITLKNGERAVQIKKGTGLVTQTIKTGVVGALGQTEIISGLKQGDIVLLEPQIK